MFKEGDKLRCKKGFIQYSNGDNTEGGAGYEAGRIITVSHITSEGNGDASIAWPVERSSKGIYFRALEFIEAQAPKSRIKLKFGK